MCSHRLASRATKTLNPMFVFQTTMYFWKIYETGEKNVHFHGAWRPSDVACFPTMSVSLLVSCEIMVRKQLRLTWYLRKLKNGWAHGSLQRGNQLCDCAARLFWFSSSVRTGSRVCHRGKHSRASQSAHCCDWCIFLNRGKCGRAGQDDCRCHPIQWCLCLSKIKMSLSLVVFRFILVFSCLVLSVFSTIPAHQDFSSHCLLILVGNQTALFQEFTRNKILFQSGPLLRLLAGFNMVTQCIFGSVALFWAPLAEQIPLIGHLW